MKTNRQSAGFTIIETVIFLSMTSLLFIVAFTGMSGRIQLVQFTDAMRSVEAYANKQFRSVDNGLNLRNELSSNCVIQGVFPEIRASYAGTPGPDDGQYGPLNSNCVINARELDFRLTTPTSLVDRALASPNKKTNASQVPLSAEPDVSEAILLKFMLIKGASAAVVTEQTYEFEWGTALTKIVVRGLESDRLVIRYAQSPISPQTYLLQAEAPNQDFSFLSDDTYVCFISNDNSRYTAMYFQSNKTVRMQSEAQDLCDS